MSTYLPSTHRCNMHPIYVLPGYPPTSNASEDRHDQRSKPLVKSNDSNHTARADCALKQGAATPTIIFVISSHSSMFVVVQSNPFRRPTIIQTAQTIAF